MKDWNLPAPSSRHRVVCQDRAYVVLNPDGKPVFGPSMRALAETKCDALNAAADGKAKRGPRACMCCRTTFYSEGIHNRMCNRCRSLRDPLDATGFAGGQDGRKPRRAARV